MCRSVHEPKQDGFVRDEWWNTVDGVHVQHDVTRRKRLNEQTRRYCVPSVSFCVYSFDDRCVTAAPPVHIELLACCNVIKAIHYVTLGQLFYGYASIGRRSYVLYYRFWRQVRYKGGEKKHSLNIFFFVNHVYAYAAHWFFFFFYSSAAWPLFQTVRFIYECTLLIFKRPITCVLFCAIL